MRYRGRDMPRKNTPPKKHFKRYQKPLYALLLGILTSSILSQPTLAQEAKAAAIPTASQQETQKTPVQETKEPETTTQAATEIQTTTLTHAFSIFGTPKYPSDFQQLSYVNAKAPTGGEIKLVSIGTFDTFNPFVSKGVSAQGLNLLYDTLTLSAPDDPYATYGLLAEKIETPADKSWVIYHLRPEARFSNGAPVLAEDVVFSFNTLTQKGKPFYQYYFSQVEKVQALDAHRVQFIFKVKGNRELPLVVGSLNVFPKKFYETKSFEKADFSIPVGSGPYQIKQFEAGKYITFERRQDYWAKSLPLFVGRYNIDRITYKYYLDDTVALEAFKAGEYDFRLENNSKMWATQYQSIHKNIKVESIAHQMPSGMQGFAVNLRRPLFQDITLRQALILAFDFEWSNKNLFYGQYTRSTSFFQNTPLAANQAPTEEEVALLKAAGDVPSEAFAKVYTPPQTDGTGKARTNLKLAFDILKQKGYYIENGQLYAPNRTKVEFEFLVTSNSAFERILLPYKKNLQFLGISLNLRSVDTSQYIERLRNFDFDMLVQTFPQSLSPGVEQRDMWTTATANIPDSNNLMGVQNKAIDYLVEQVIAATTQEQLTTRTRALDRVLQWNHYVVPNWHINYHRLAYWNQIHHPAQIPPYDLDLNAWWIDTQSHWNHGEAANERTP